MRITEEEKKVIRDAVHSLDPEAAVYLFGSRADDNARGGDIDLLVISKKIQFPDKLEIRKQLFYQMEEQKIDIVIANDAAAPFVEHAMENGIRIG